VGVVVERWIANSLAKMTGVHRMDRRGFLRGFGVALAGVGAGIAARPMPERAFAPLTPQCGHCFAMLEQPYGKTREETYRLITTPRTVTCSGCGAGVVGVRFAEPIIP